jgi:hypothetical protein
MQYVLIDESNGATTTSGEALTLDILAKAASLLTVFLNAHVAKYWGIPGGASVRVGTGPDDLQPNELPAHIRATITEAPGAIAYHTINGVGVPAIEDGLTLSDTLFGPGGWLVAMSHEMAETEGDPGTNILCADNSGKLFARELGDPVEAFGWNLVLPDGTSGFVTNFVLPSYFVTGSPGPYDYMTAMGFDGAVAPPGPFQIAPAGGGDYQIWEPDPQNEQQVTAVRMGAVKRGELAPLIKPQVDGCLDHRAAKKRYIGSRLSRRGVRLAG